MCLASYIPLGSDSFVLTSNRDEAPHRAANNLVQVQIKGKNIAFPGDIKGGSWLFASQNGDVLCLLNGAKVNHSYHPPYRMSRGVLLKEFFEYETAFDFVKRVNLLGIEPFTLVIRTRDYFYELIWDGSKKYVKQLDMAKIYVWSSSTLYAPDAQKQRQQWFFEEIDAVQLSPQTAREIHKKGGAKDLANGFLMNRDERVKTISLSQVLVNPEQITLWHHDLVGMKEVEVKI